MRIVLPKRSVCADLCYGPFFFLAGPIKGGGDWQNACCNEIKKQLPDFYAAVPCRYEEGHPLTSYVVRDTINEFDRQLTWERIHLDFASRYGCIIFWLPEEDKANPRKDGNPYARDTYGEIGEWRSRLKYEPSNRVVVGADPGFPGLSQIQRNFNQQLKTDFPIYTTLSETVTAAIKKAVPYLG